MPDLGLHTFTAPVTNGKKRRSTRVFQPIPVSVYARNRLGNAFKESTTASTVNCHGCLYTSRHEYQSGSWITLEIPCQQNSERPQAVRAQVRYVRLPQSPRDLYQVGVELEAPGNVWGIKSPPEDWLRFPALVALPTAPSSAAPQPAANGQQQPSASSAPPRPAANGRKPAAAPPSSEPRPDSGKPVRVVVSPDQLLRALEGKLQQSAEKAVAAAVSAQLGPAVNQAAKAIDNFVQASIRRADDQCTQYRDKLLASTQEALMNRLQTDLSEADAHLRGQLDGCIARAQEAAERLERSAAGVQPALDRAQEFLGKGAGEFQERFSATLQEAVARAASEFDRTAAGLAEQRLAHLTERAEGAGNQAASRLEAKADEVRLAVETATGTALAEFHVVARNELERAVEEARQGILSSLSAFAAEAREDWDSRRRAFQGDLEHAVEEARRNAESSLSAFAAESRQDWDRRLCASRNELAEAGQREIEEFRRQMGSILNTSMVAAVSAVSEHSRALLASLAQTTEPQPAEPPAQAESGHAAD